MARYYRRRYTRTLVKPKKKWASNLVDVSPVVIENANRVAFKEIICQNANPTNIPTPVILKTGNFKLQCDAFFNISGPSTVQVSAYIMYVPEGSVLDTIDDILNIIKKHPEWIMAWKFGSFDYVSGTADIQTIRASSRLKRNLNSGDSIMFLAYALTGLGTTFTTKGIRGQCQYWTCAN